MIDTRLNQQPEMDASVTEEREDEDEEILYYTEKSTNLLYEVKLFQDFAMIRLIMPDNNTPVGRIDLPSFSELYEPFSGHVGELKGILYGAIPSYFEVRRKHDWNE